MLNLVQEYADLKGKTVIELLKQYDDACIDFAGEVVDTLGKGSLAYFVTDENPVWRFHAAVEFEGFIHDLWLFPDVLPIEQYMEAIGATSVEYPAEEMA